MRYKFADISTTHATIGDMSETIDIETVDMTPSNDLSGDHEDSIVALAANVWAAVDIREVGVKRMLTINVDKEEVATHTFYCGYWAESFLEARFIKWKGIRYRILKPQDIRGQVSVDFQVKFPCVLKGSTSKEANTWA